MFKIIDSKDNFKPVKSRFKSASQALDWAKKNLSEECNPFGNLGYYDRYFIQKY
jgi:hypothetical protein